MSRNSRSTAQGLVYSSSGPGAATVRPSACRPPAYPDIFGAEFAPPSRLTCEPARSPGALGVGWPNNRCRRSLAAQPVSYGSAGQRRGGRGRSRRPGCTRRPIQLFVAVVNSAPADEPVAPKITTTSGGGD